MCFLKLKGNVLIKDLLSKHHEELVHEQSELSIYPISMDNNIYLEYEKKDKKTDEEESASDVYKTQLLQCLVGTREGTIYIYDPIMISNAKILSFNNDQTMPFFKARRPEIVKWVEPTPHRVDHISRDGKTKEKIFQLSTNKFAVVFDDATIYIYEKDVVADSKEDARKAMIQTSSN